jgi:FkbM family methyltransferase
MLLESLPNTLAFIAEFNRHHARDSTWYAFTDATAKRAIAEVRERFEHGEPVELAEIGAIVLPYRKMGAVDTLDLFGLDELMMFAYYWRNRNTYKAAMDIGANVGLHSLILAKLGIQVTAFEPDPQHFAVLQRNLELNGVADRVMPRMAAVSDRDGTMEFVRVLGNTTSSHLAGAKANPYGELERFPVEVVAIGPIAAEVGLAKIDAEGHEATLLGCLSREVWRTLDAFVEVGTPENAAAIFDLFADGRANIFTQKTGWNKIDRLADMPVSYREGGIFISAKSAMRW